MFFEGQYKTNAHFNPNGTYNGYQSWLSDDSTLKIIWDTSINAWRMSGSSLGSTQVINTNPAYPPINNNWTVIGDSYSVDANQGVCPPLDLLEFTTSLSNPTCTCDGTITIQATGGVPPYGYSFNNGLTYGTSAIANGLCGGQYSVKVIDNVGTVVSSTVTLAQQTSPTQYTLTASLLGSATLVSTTTTTTVQDTYSLSVSPPLPNGVTITFDMSLYSQFIRTPYSNSANYTFTTQVLKNGNPISYIDNTVESTQPNAQIGCQSYLTYTRNVSHNRNTITITSTDTFTIQTVSTLNKTCNNTPTLTPTQTPTPTPTPPGAWLPPDEWTPIPFGFDLENYAGSYLDCCSSTFDSSNISLSNASITGCNCCTVVISDPFYNRS